MNAADIETAIGTLPDKLSDLLEVALDDFEKVTKLPNVNVDMMTYCESFDGAVCSVCLAGSVIASRIGVDNIISKSVQVGPARLRSEGMDSTAVKLEAVSAAALGKTERALRYLGFECPDEVPSCREKQILPPEELIPEMRSLIHLLRTHGL